LNCFAFSLSRAGTPPALHSFPTRRSSDLGRSMTAAARSRHVSVERLRRYLVQESLAERKGRLWITNDSRPRRLPVMTGGTIKTLDRKSTRLNSSHVKISYAVFCLKKKKKK